MSELLKNLLSHLTPHFQPAAPTDSGVVAITTADTQETPYIEEASSAGALLIECLRGYAPRRRLPDMPRAPGGARREADMYFAITMAASRIM
ncbi:MAG: hypothetical protein U1E86_23295 [Burkholderiaceae bacterium]